MNWRVYIHRVGSTRSRHTKAFVKNLREQLRGHFLDATEVHYSIERVEDEKLTITICIYRLDTRTFLEAYYYPEWNKLEMYEYMEV